MTNDQTLTCDEIADLASAVALDVAEPEVVREVEAHAERCPPCARVVDDMRETAAALALDSPQVSPPVALKGRMLGAALRERPARVTPITPRRGWLQRLSPIAVAAAAAIVVSMGSVAWAASLQGQVSRLQAEADSTRDRAARYDRIVAVLSSNELAIRPLTPAEFAAGATGMIYLDPTTRQGMIMVHALPPLQPNRVYQLWFQRGNERVSGGVLRADATGTGYTIINVPPDLTSFESVGVTEEPQGGSTWPTTPRVVWSRIRSD